MSPGAYVNLYVYMSTDISIAKLENFHDQITVVWCVVVASATWCDAERGAIGANAGRERRGGPAPARHVGRRI